ncbi:MAG: thermonuclease family protein [Bacilli bacterium]|nr:thermonuclease family protein [Bacilli bacterium]
MMKIRSLFPLVLAVSALASCGAGSQSQASQGGEKSKGDANWVDYASSSAVKLKLEYKDRKFMTDGVAQVKLHSAIDGDTAHFTPVYSSAIDDTIKSRFYGIDTPESTGKVQPYGKPASNYTAKILEEADKNGTIVVTAASLTYAKPQADSTGSRYLSLIWVNTEKKDAPISEMKLLNLMIVQEGLSWVKAVNEVPDYVETFYAAEAQAKEYKLNLHSGLPDELYNYGDYEDASLLDLKKEVVATLADPTHENAYHNKKVRVQGTVAGFSNHVLYITDFFPEKDAEGNAVKNPDGTLKGEYAAINIFCGMGAIPSKFTIPNTYIQVCGLALESQFGFQITDVTLPTVAYSENDAKVVIKAAANTDEHALHNFEYTAAQVDQMLVDSNYESLYCSVSVTTEVTVSSINKTSSATYMYFENAKFHAYYTFNYQPEKGTTWATEDLLVGKTFKISGVLTTHTTQSGKLQLEILPRSSEDMVYVPASE